MSYVTLDYWAEEYENESVSIGEDRAILNSIRNLMKSLNFTRQQAMDALYIPQEERKHNADKL